MVIIYGSNTCASDTALSAPDAIAFEDVTVIPMDREHALAHHTVLVRGNRIVALGPAARIVVPTGAVRINGAHKYLLPGLTEMHAHLPAAGFSATAAEDLLFLYVANGVTAVRGMQGDPAQLELRERVNRGAVIGPRLILGSPALYGRTVTDPAQARLLVQEYQAAGYDLIKVHEGLSEEVFAAVADAARTLQMPFAGHIANDVGLRDALIAGQSTIEHMDGYVEALVAGDRAAPDPSGFAGIGALLADVNPALIRGVVDATRATGAAVVPTLVVWEEGLFPTHTLAEITQARPELKYVSKQMSDQWVQLFERRRKETNVEDNRRVHALRRSILLALHKGGARILLGSDSPQVFNVPGFSIHREMRAYVETGISPYEVLASGTRHVAEHFGVAGDLGTVAVGKVADLVLVDDNPLEAIENAAQISGVMVNGKWLDRDVLDAGLERIAASR